jgi:phospholipid/cholesterol/gamma-HCH transport system substrate-binding protein
MSVFRRQHKRRKPMSKFAAGVIGIVVLVLFTYGGFTKFANPFASHFTVYAVTPSANNLRPNSLVRIAGVNVGKVTTISSVPGTQAAKIAMDIENNGLPLHSNATFWIRPRIFLEGNFFVDVSPGTPSAPTVSSGHVFPIQQVRLPVQIDQVLNTLQADTRRNLQILLKEYGTGVYNGGPAFARSIPFWTPAYKYSSVVAHDLLGLQPHDLSNAIYEQGTVSAAFNANPQDLQSLITDFNTTALAFARESGALQNTVAQLPPTLAAATPAFNALNAAFPPVRALARALLPGVESTGPTIDASLPFINQLRLLVQPSELQGLTQALVPTVPALANLTNQTIPFMKKQVRPASSCVVNNYIPWSNLQINDSNFNASNGFPPRPAYVEDLQLLPGLAGESRSFDANGPIIRLLFGGGTFTYSILPGSFGTALTPIIGVQPVPPPNNERPPLAGGDVPNAPCETQRAITNLNAPVGPPPPQISAASSPASQALDRTEVKLAGVSLTQALRSVGSSVKLGGAWAPTPGSVVTPQRSGAGSRGTGSGSEGAGTSQGTGTGTSQASGATAPSSGVSSSSAAAHPSSKVESSRR